MKAHYTTFKGEEQFEVLRDKARQLGGVAGYWDGDNYFGFNSKMPMFISYYLEKDMSTSEWYQEATYLPYTEYLDYLDKCIKEKA
jgi:hypothetical protein